MVRPAAFPFSLKICQRCNNVIFDNIGLFPCLNVPKIKGTWEEVRELLKISKEEPPREPFMVAVIKEVWENQSPAGGLQTVLDYLEDCQDTIRRRNLLIKNLRSGEQSREAIDKKYPFPGA